MSISEIFLVGAHFFETEGSLLSKPIVALDSTLVLCSMESQDFEMPSPKRQRTESPIEAQRKPAYDPTISSSSNQLEELAQDNKPSTAVAGESVPAMTGNTAAKAVEVENTDMLDVLMQHVESAAGSSAAVNSPPATEVPTTEISTAAVDVLQEPGMDIVMGENDDGTGPRPVISREEADTTEAVIAWGAHTAQEAFPVQEQVSPQGTVASQQPQPQPTPTAQQDAPFPPGLEPTSKPALDHHLEVAEVNNLPPTADTLVQNELPSATTGTLGEQAAPEAREWETDSSFGSSDSSDTSDSSDDDSDSDDGEEYTLLDPYEQARILMAEDGGGGAGDSDDEGTSRPARTNAGAGLRTTNEKADEILPKPDVTVTENMTIELLGTVEAAIETTVLIKAATSGSYQVLESGSVLCLADRSVVGAVQDTLGRVEQPLYTVRFASDTDVRESGLSEKGTKIYYVKDHSTFVFTQPLKAFKGSDASNFHDEEVGDEEMEFSDDEAEAEHKRQVKLRRKGIDPSTVPPPVRGGRGRGQRGGRGAPGGGRGGTYMSSIPESDTASAYRNGSLEMNYDDVEDGETEYTPLKRPEALSNGNGNSMGMGMTMNDNPQMSPPSQTSYRPQNSRGNYSHTQNQDRGGRGRDRGRGNQNNRGRGRGRGNNNRDSQNNRAYENNSHSNPYNQSSSTSMYTSTHQAQPPQQNQSQQYSPQQPQSYFYQQPPPPPQLTPQSAPYNPNPNGTNTNTAFVPPSPMTPLAGPGNFTFNAPIQQQYPNPNQWAQYHQNQNQGYTAQQGQYTGNADAIAQVQRQLEELRRQTQGGRWMGGGQQ